MHACECVSHCLHAYTNLMAHTWRECPKYYSSKSLKRNPFSDTFPMWRDVSWDPVLLARRQIAAAPLPIIPLSLTPYKTSPACYHLLSCEFCWTLRCGWDKNNQKSKCKHVSTFPTELENLHICNGWKTQYCINLSRFAVELPECICSSKALITVNAFIELCIIYG